MDEPAPWNDGADLAAVLDRITELKRRRRELLSDLEQCRAHIAAIEAERRARIAALLAGRPPAEEKRAVDGN